MSDEAGHKTTVSCARNSGFLAEGWGFFLCWCFFIFCSFGVCLVLFDCGFVFNSRHVKKLPTLTYQRSRKVSCLPWSTKQCSQPTSHQNTNCNTSWEWQWSLLPLSVMQQNWVAERSTGEGRKDPKMQNLSNQLAETPVSKQSYLLFNSWCGRRNC